MTPLPPELERLVDRVLAAADLPAGEAREVRSDLTDHFRDGLEAGRSPQELAERFGSPEEAARRLAAGATPPTRRGATFHPTASVLADLGKDLRTTVRRTVKAPVTSATVSVVLALGIGLSVVVYSIVNALLLEPLPVREAATLVDVWPDIPGGNSFLGFAYGDFETFRESGVLEALAAFIGVTVTVGEEGSGEDAVAMIATPSYLTMLGVEPLMGSATFPADAAFGDAGGLIVTHAFWERRLGGRPDIVGTTLRLDGRSMEIIGVTEPGFRGHFIGFPTDVFLPVSAAPLFLDGFDPADRGGKVFEMIGRARPGSSTAVLEQELNQVAARIEADFPELNRGHRVGVTPTTGFDHSMHAGVVGFAGMLVAMSLFVLAIACLNAGGILLVRGLARDREIAVRMALGAGRPRLVRELMTEALVLAGIGAFLGSLLAVRVNTWLSEWLSAVSGGRLGLSIEVDGMVMGLTTGSAVVAALCAGLAPTLRLLRKDPATALRARGAVQDGGTSVRGALIVAQVAASVVLTTATGLFGRTLLVGARLDPGFDADRVGSVRLQLDSARLGGADAATVLRRIVDRVDASPSITAASWASSSLLGVARTPTHVRVRGVQPPAGQEGWIVDSRRVGVGFFEASGIPLLRGRDIARADMEGAEVAVVSQAFAERFWPDGDAIGRSLEIEGSPVNVVGVAADARYLVQDETPDPLLYRAGDMEPLVRATLIVQSADPAGSAPALSAAVQAVLPSHPHVSVRTARRALTEVLLPQRAATMLVGAMGAIAGILAGLGLYGLMQFTVTRDTPALGVRRALGATSADLVFVVMRRGFLVAGGGVLVGLLLAFGAASTLRSLLPGISPFDPVTYVGVLGLFVGVALASSWVPSLRAARLAPTEALRGG